MKPDYKEDEEEKKFKIRSYGKSELAALYMPDISPKSAAEVLRKWIARFPGLAESLASTGLRAEDRRYTPAQVRLIVRAIGLPEE